MFKKQWDDRELDVMVSSASKPYISSDNKENGEHFIDANEIVLAKKIEDFAVDMAEQGWKRGKKEGFILGIFIGAIVVFFLRTDYFEPKQLEDLKTRVNDCIQVTGEEFYRDRLHECIQEEFSNYL